MVFILDVSSLAAPRSRSPEGRCPREAIPRGTLPRSIRHPATAPPPLARLSRSPRRGGGGALLLDERGRPLARHDSARAAADDRLSYVDVGLTVTVEIATGFGEAL